MNIDKNSWLLWAKFSLLNIIGFAGLALLQINGYIDQVIEGDRSHITIIIFGLFVIGLVLTAIRIYRLSSEINYLRAGKSNRLKEYTRLVKNNGEVAAKQVIEIKLIAKMQWIRRIASSLVQLGLIGTVYGTMIFMLNIDLAAIADIERVAEVFGVVMNGMGIALYTTLVGAVLNLWLSYNYGIVEHGTSYLLAHLISHKE